MIRASKPGTPTVLAHVLLVSVTLVWGATFPLVKAALREVSPLLFNFMRMVMASLLLLAASWKSVRQLTRGQVKLCALAGCFLAFGYELQTSGLQWTTPSKSAFLTGLVVVLVPLLSLIPGLHGKHSPRPHAASYVGALIAFLGIVLLTSEPGAGAALLSGMHRGEWLSLGCALAFAVHLLILARSANLVPPRALGTLQILFAAGIMFLLLPVQRQPAFHASWLVATALLVSAVLSTAAAFTIQSWAQQYLPASHTALILTLEPVFAWAISLLFLGERLGARALSGAGGILLGIILAELGPTVFPQKSIVPLVP